MKKTKKIIYNVLIILMLLVLVLYFSLRDNYKEIFNIIKNSSYLWLIVAVILFISYRLLISFSYYNIVKVNNQKVRLSQIIKMNFIILFFNGITPFATGGQPMEVYYLHTNKISLAKSTNIALQNFIIYQTILILFGMFALIYNLSFNIFPHDKFMNKLTVLGFSLNIVVYILIFIVSFNKKISSYVINKILKFLSKIKIIKSLEKTQEKVQDYLDSFYENTLILKKNKKAVIVSLILDLLGLITLYSVPLAIIFAFNIKNITLVKVLVSTAFTMMIGAFIPVPGATGGLEYGFVYFYKYLLTSNTATATMLIWRFVTYYLAMIMGAIMLMTYKKEGE